ncbi:hypothetical protein [Candidatus Spongiihabitans sp.]
MPNETYAALNVCLDYKEFGYAERFNNWIARNKPGNDGLGETMVNRKV